MTDNPGVADTSLVEFGQTGQYPGTGQDAMPDWKKTAGFAPLETLPAAWFNGYMNELDTHINQLQNLTLQIQTEMANLMSAASVTPSDTNLTQIRQSIQKLIQSSNDLLIAPEFDAEVSYSVGQYVLYNDYLYICTTAHTGAWNSAHFAVTKVGTKLTELKTAIDTALEGIGTLTDLTTTDKTDLVSAINEVNAKVSTVQYSTDEFDMLRKWTDGKTIYGKVLTNLEQYMSDKLNLPASPVPAGITALTVFNNTLYVGTAQGIYTSTDGVTFTQNTSFPTSYVALALTVFNNTLYVGTRNRGIYTSTDGSTFTQNTSFPTSYVALAFTVFNNTLYVEAADWDGIPDGIYTSTDGSAFAQNTSFPTSIRATGFAVFNNTLYVGSSSYTTYHLYESADGAVFTAISAFPNTMIYGLAVFNNTLYVGTYNEGLYTSTDGATFTQNTSFPTSGFAFLFGVFNNTLYAGTYEDGLYTSTDGTTFTLSNSYPSVGVSTFTIFDSVLYISGGDGLYTSTDGFTFKSSSNFPTAASTINCFTIFNNVLYVGSTKLYASTDGSTFTTKAALRTNAFAIFNNTLYVATSDGLYKSPDGSTLTRIFSGFPVTANSFTSLAVFNNTLYAGVSFCGIYTSTNGSTFTQNASFPSNYTVNEFTIFNNTLYAGTSSHGIYTSTDGSTFTQNSSFPTNYTVSSLCVFRNTLYVGTNSHGIYTSTDGATFAQNSSFPTGYTAQALAVFNSTLYVGTNSHGIYTSTDGATFTRINGFPSNYSVYALCVFNSTLYIGTNSHGIYISGATVAVALGSLHISELLFTHLRGSDGPIGLKSAYVDNLNNLCAEAVEGVPTQAIIEYTKQEA